MVKKSRKLKVSIVIRNKNEAKWLKIVLKKISIQRGHDITKYVLSCYGGASGQHACSVADSLGIKKIICLISSYKLTLKNNNKKLAKETFQSILNLKTSPSSLSTRARNMVEYLKEE